MADRTFSYSINDFAMFPFGASILGRSMDPLAELGRSKLIFNPDGNGPGLLIDAAPGRLDSGGINRVGGAEVTWGEAITPGQEFDIALHDAHVSTLHARPTDQFLSFGGRPAAGDFDGDGVVDVIVPSPFTNQVLVYEVPNDASDVDLSGAFTGFYINTGVSSVSSADLNGDGFSDIVVGYNFDSQVRIVWGTNQQFSGTVDPNSPPPGLSFSGIDGAPGLGRVVVAGDWDGDSLTNDIAILSNNNLYIVHNVDQANPLDTIDVTAPPAGVNVRMITGFDFGSVDIADPWDVTGDGTPDLLIGLGDQNRAVLVPMDNPFSPFSINGPLPTGSTEFIGVTGGRFGNSVALTDVNGDGLADVVVGDPGFSPNPSLMSAGRLVIYPSRMGMPAMVQTDDAEAAEFFEFHGSAPGQQLGISVTGGNLDGDEFPDVAAGANYDSRFSEQGGTNFIVFGSTLLAANTPPVAAPDLAATTEDTTVVISPLGNDTDADGDPISLVGATAPGGTVTVAGDTLIFDPRGAFDTIPEGTVTPINIEYTITDGHATATGIIETLISGVNDPPIAVEDEATTDEDTSILIDALDNDIDVDGGPLTIQAVGIVGADQGSVEIENNMIRYTPNPDFEALTGTQSALVEVFYQVSDGLGGVDTGTVFVTVNGVNDAPVANPDTATTSLDTAVTIPVLNNDSDAEGPVTLVAAFPAAPSGTVTANPDGTITYTPEAGFTGTATFEYRITDSDGVTADAAVTVNVAPPNRPPVAMDDMDMVDEDTALTIAIADLLNNDGDPDIPVPGDMISFVDFFYLDLGPDVDGSMMRVGDNLIYTPDPNFNGDDFFTYTIRDIAGATDTAIVDITVKPVNDDPEAADKDVMTDEDKAITISIDDLLNDSDDVDGDMLSFDGFTYIDAGPDVDGSMVRVGNTLVYTPDKDFNGTDFFFYDISDGNGGTDTGTVNITVKPINDAPVANDDMVMTNEGEALFIQISDLLSNDDDVDIIDGDMISFDGFIYIDLGPEADGSLTRAGNVLVYRPDLDLDRDRFDPDDDFNGDDFFTYTISDKDGETSTATVDIVVKPVNDAPFANPDLFATDEDMAITLSFDELLGPSLRKLNPADEQEDTDPDFDAPGDDPTLFLDIIAVGGATRGNVVVDFLAGTITYTPDANFNGTDSFTYTIEDTGIGDPAGLRDVGVVTIRVDPVNDDPFIIPPQLELFTLPDLPVSYLVQAGDIDGDALTVTVSDPANGMLSDGPGFAEVIYTPDMGFTGTDGWTTLVTDVAGATASQQVTVTVGELPPADDFVAFASAGFTGGFGGSGQVVGDSGFQDITIFDQPGLITLDPSFNAANSPGLTDIVRLSGLASDWFIVRRGSSALLSDGDTFLLVPVGSKGIALVFDNFTLNLRFDTAENTFKIGEQSFGSDQFDQIAAIEELATLPTGSDPNAVAAMFVADDAAVSAGGRVDIFGTQGPQMFSLMGGRINFDPSSNSGGDTFTIPDFAIDGTGQRNGSSFFFDGPTTDLLIPVGTTASTLNFADGPRDLLFNTASNNIELGGQIIGFTPVELMALG